MDIKFSLFAYDESKHEDFCHFCEALYNAGFIKAWTYYFNRTDQRIYKIILNDGKEV